MTTEILTNYLKSKGVEISKLTQDKTNGQNPSFTLEVKMGNDSLTDKVLKGIKNLNTRSSIANRFHLEF